MLSQSLNETFQTDPIRYKIKTTMNVKANCAETINTTCPCKTLDRHKLLAGLGKENRLEGLDQKMMETRPHLFSSTTVFINQKNIDEIKHLISVIDRTIKSSNFKKIILANAPQVAKPDWGTSGVFMGYDFHLTDEGPKLIEINTNAGGAFLNAELARSQTDCCGEFKFEKNIEKIFYDMFLNEWTLQKGTLPLRTVAIVDESPESQFLFPEFKLFEWLLNSYNVQCFILDPKDLVWRDQKLWYGEVSIDLIYNRLTDFYLENDKLKVLKNAYLSGSVVMTPNPHHFALYANKANFEVLSHQSHLMSLDISPADINTLLKGIPATEKLVPGESEAYWNRRKELFFKPMIGYGSKAGYRGDKITKRVWEEILQGDYVAQKIVPPSRRVIEVDGKKSNLKVDLRAYVYAGSVQFLAARLYSGQTTNFRTEGGGFAPVCITQL